MKLDYFIRASKRVFERRAAIFCALFSAILVAACGGSDSGSGGDSGSAPASVIKAARIAQPSSVFYGVNGHNGYGSNYRSTPAATQLGQLQDIGMTVYRNEVFSPSSASDISRLAQAMQPGGVMVYPVLLMDVGFGSTYYYTSEEAAYDAGYAFGQQVVSVQTYPYYEVSNELAAQCLVGPVDGVRTTDYDNLKFQTARGVIRGMIAGIRSGDATGKIILGGDTWMHTAFAQMLAAGTQPDGTGGHPVVTWDVTGWHWFSDQGDITHACGGTGCYNVLAILKSLGRPIWITELGVRPSVGNPEQTGEYLVWGLLSQLTWLAPQYGIESIQIYELYDDPPGGEGPYGLIENDAKTPKPGYRYAKQFIAAHPH